MNKTPPGNSGSQDRFRRALGLVPIHRRHLERLQDSIGGPILYAALWIAKRYRPSFHRTRPAYHRVADRLSVHLVIDHYHEPMIQPSAHISRSRERRDLPGLELNEPSQLALLAAFSYQAELGVIPEDPASPSEPGYRNWAYGPGDASVLYSMTRRFKPKTVVEVGSGQSTKFLARALSANSSDGAPPPRHVCIEPFESPFLAELDVELLREKVEDIDPAFFRALGEDDVLFIDSSHVVRPQGDVLYLYQRVLPRLAPGVLVHIHDIFTPRDYPADWVSRRWLWDEQYMVEALLSGNLRFEVVLANNLMYVDHHDAFIRACPEADLDTGVQSASSLWLRVRAG